MATDVTITLETSPNKAEEQVVRDGLRAFNVRVIGQPNERPVDVFVRDAEGRVLGGLVGVIKWRWLYVAKLWLPDSLRGRDLGTAIMRRAEEHAWSEDCLGVYLDTFEYQALGFYQKLGYELYGTLEGFPPGYRQFYLRKARPT